MPSKRRPALIDLEAGRPWYVRSDLVETRHRNVWSHIAFFTFVIGNILYIDIIYMLVDKDIFRHRKTSGCLSCGVVLGVATTFMLSYFSFFLVVAYVRLPGPYKLRPIEKQSFDCAFVVVCSCWVFYMRGQMYTTMLGLVYCFHVVPMLNLWWDYENFGFWDCALTAMIEAALFFSRGYVVILVVVAGVGVALQLRKNANQEQSIKSVTEK